MELLPAVEQTARRGGQASLGLFGYRSFTAPVGAPVRLAPRRRDDQPRRVGGLTYGQRAARIRSMVAVAAIASRKGQAPASPRGTAFQSPSEHLARLYKIGRPPVRRSYDATWSDAQYQEWLDEVHADCVAHQARMADLAADEYDGYGLARPSTPAMQRAAAESDRRDEREWRELADLAACPEWGRCTDAASIEIALAHD